MLDGRRIALLERRHHREFASLVEKLGGVPVIAPAMDEVVSLDDYHTFVNGLRDGRFSIAVLLSGVGFLTLMKEVERRGRLHPVLDALRQLTFVCRGAKPLAALTAYKLKPQLTTVRPHTTRELERALATIDVDGRGVVLVHSGERNTEVAEGLRARSARLVEVFPYERTLPDNQGPLAQVVRDVIAGRIDVMLFTNQSQCRHLFEVARQMSQAEGLALSLRQSVVVGAVGPVSARALERAGIVPDIVPATGNMPALLNAVIRYFEKHPSD
jgi:uroporphyrinogen-III synthase